MRNKGCIVGDWVHGQRYGGQWIIGKVTKVYKDGDVEIGGALLRCETMTVLHPLTDGELDGLEPGDPLAWIDEDDGEVCLYRFNHRGVPPYGKLEAGSEGGHRDYVIFKGGEWDYRGRIYLLPHEPRSEDETVCDSCEQKSPINCNGCETAGKPVDDEGVIYSGPDHPDWIGTWRYEETGQIMTVKWNRSGDDLYDLQISKPPEICRPGAECNNTVSPYGWRGPEQDGWTKVPEWVPPKKRGVNTCDAESWFWR